MGRLLLYEWKKLAVKRWLFFFFVLCFFVNALWLHYRLTEQNDYGYSQKNVADVYGEVLGDDVSAADLEEKIAAYQDMLFAGEDSFDLPNYMILSKIDEQMLRLDGYSDYLASIREQANLRISSPLFSNPGTYSYRNQIATVKAYEPLDGLSLKADFDGGILSVTENTVTDILILLILAAAALQIFIAEREDGTWGFQRSMKQGHGTLLAAKLAAAMLIAVALVLIFYGADLVVAVRTVGFGDLTRPVQSVEDCFTSTFLMNAGEYLLVFVLAKMATFLCISCIFAAVCLLTGNSILSVLLGIIIYGAETVLWNSISINSWFSVLKEVNLAALMDTESYFSEYYNINLFSWPVSHFACGMITCALSGVLGIFCAFIFYNRETIFSARHVLHFVHGRRERKERRAHSLLYYEMYKILIVNKGAIVLSACLCLAVLVYCSTDSYIDEEEFYYRYYSYVLTGDLTQEKEAFLEEEEEMFQSVNDKLDALALSYDRGEIDSNQLEYYRNRIRIPDSRTDAFERARSQYDDLQALASEGRTVDYVYLTPWNFLFRTGRPEKELLILMEAFAVMILVLCAGGAMEKNACMNQVIKISSRGMNGVIRKKALIAAIIAVIVAMVVFLPELLCAIRVYGLGDLTLSAAGFTAGTLLAGVPLTMGMYLILREVLRELTVLAMTFIMLFISEKLGNIILSLLTGTALFIFPILVFLLG